MALRKAFFQGNALEDEIQCQKDSYNTIFRELKQKSGHHRTKEQDEENKPKKKNIFHTHTSIKENYEKI